MTVPRKKANPNNNSEMTLYGATKHLISTTGAREVSFTKWSLPLNESGPAIARIRLNKAYVFEKSSYEWIVLPGTIESDPERKFTRGLILIPNVKTQYPGPTKDYSAIFLPMTLTTMPSGASQCATERS